MVKASQRPALIAQLPWWKYASLQSLLYLTGAGNDMMIAIEMKRICIENKCINIEKGDREKKRGDDGFLFFNKILTKLPIERR